MDLQGLRRPAEPVATGGALLFLLVLSLDWYEVSAEVANAVRVDEAASGWSNGWGLVAGLLAIALIVGHRLPERLHSDLAVLVAAVGLVVSAGLAAFTGAVDVEVAGAVGVQVETTLGAAWAGFGIAVVVALAELVALAPSSRGERRAGTAFPSSA
jgi:hypothetical protein